MGAYSRVVRWGRQDQVWILERPLWLRGGEGISRAVLWLGQSLGGAAGGTGCLSSGGSQWVKGNGRS